MQFHVFSLTEFIDSCLFWISLEGQSSLLSLSGTYIQWADVPRALSSLGWTVPDVFVSSCSSLHLLQYFHITLVLWGGKTLLPWTCRGQSLSCSPGCCQPSLFQWCIAGSQSLIMLKVVSVQSPRSFLQSYLPVAIAPSLHWCMRLFLPRTEHFSLDFIKLLLTCISSLSRFIWMKYKHPLYHPSFLLYVVCKLSEDVLCPITRSLIAMLNSTGPSIYFLIFY